jgi:hypothetical protein
LALLAVAKTVVDFMAFQILPLKFIYKQYRTIDTVDFSDLTDADAAVFRKHDIINPHPKIGLAKVTSSNPLTEPMLPKTSDAGAETEMSRVATVHAARSGSFAFTLLLV